ncbi:serine/threonine-protein kinase [Streptomyces oceani]|uniref:serine/threonine-protein kinase n=1 Tax=Streptomyces oceani TaxID=1075402 RepID=UPI0008723423|nr:serine/threonine-protein kinase [Streptomyces oceani]
MGGSGQLEPGTRIAGDRYELCEPLGEGGMAEVFRAWDTALGRSVAVKFMRLGGEDGADAERRKRFHREAQHAARLAHARLAAIHDVGDHVLEDGARMPYLVMEWVPGRTLAETLAERGGGLPWETALRLVAEVLEALEFVHAQDLVHRDIKPANVMVTEQGGVKVMDFGIARAIAPDNQLTSLTGTGFASPGTPHYMAPEQAEGGHLDGRTDLYAVGVLLFELLTGSTPFEADTPLQLMYQHVHKAPPTLAVAGASVPLGVERVVARALSKQAAQRAPSARAMAAEIAAVRQEQHTPSAGQPQYAPTVDAPERVPAGDGHARPQWSPPRHHPGPGPASGGGAPHDPTMLPGPAGGGAPRVGGHAGGRSVPRPGPPGGANTPMSGAGQVQRNKVLPSLIIVPVAFLQAVLIFDMLMFLPAALASYGAWLAVTGGVRTVRTDTGAGSRLWQLLALVATLLNVLIALASLVSLAYAVG